MTQTLNTLSPEMQAAEDLLQALAAQRNELADQNVQLRARLTAAMRKIAELEPKEGEAPSLTNGHDANEPEQSLTA